MKWKRVLWSLCGILLLAGCGKTNQNPVSSPDSINYSDYIMYVNSIAYMDSAYLFQKGDHIFYLDADLSGRLSPMCARADCSHRDSRCNSYVPGTIFSWNNQLYYLDDADGECLKLMRMDPGGTNREEIRDVGSVLAGGEGYTFSCSLGGGYLILEGSRYQPWGEQPFLYLLSVENSREEPVTVYLGEEGSTTRLWTGNRVFGDWVFYPQYEEDAPDVLTLMRYQISTGKTVKLTENNDYITTLMMQENAVYWCTLSEGVFACDMDTLKVRQIIEWSLPREQGGKYYQYSIAADHQYIYMARLGFRGEPTGEEGLTIYDLKGNEIQYISYAGMEQPLEYLLATPEAVIWGPMNEMREPEPAYYLRRRAIAEGKAEFIGLAK